LLASVVGQDIINDGGVFRIARKVASDRVISTVDPDARHGHKTQARGFDGYKGHIALDPDSEIITATTATPGNSGDAEVAEDLLADLLPSEAEAEAGNGDGAAVYGDAAYGAGELLARLNNANIHNGLKVQPPSSVKGHFSKDRFSIDLDKQTVTCPAGVTATIRSLNHQRHAGIAEFGMACATCPLASQCTGAKAGRTITIGHYEAQVPPVGLGKPTPSGEPTTRPPAPKSNARSAT
jgi:hypothetical protein